VYVEIREIKASLKGPSFYLLKKYPLYFRSVVSRSSMIKNLLICKELFFFVMPSSKSVPIFFRKFSVAYRFFLQYTSSAQSPIEGFYVYYRTTSSAGDYIKATVEGEQTRQYIITHLLPDTSYDIKLQSFTVGAASDFSLIRTHKTQRKCPLSAPSAFDNVMQVLKRPFENVQDLLFFEG